MKRLCLIIAVLLLANPLLAQQPEEGVARHAFKVNLLSFLGSGIDVNYEFRIARRSAVTADLAADLLQSYNEPMKTHAVFAQTQYRFYLNDQRRSGVMPFVGIGLNYTHAWMYLNCFTGNDGWDIHTTKYYYRGNFLRPALAFGLKVNIPFGLVVETTAGVLPPYIGEDETQIMLQTKSNAPNYFCTQFSLRLGWAF